MLLAVFEQNCGHAIALPFSKNGLELILRRRFFERKMINMIHRDNNPDYLNSFLDYNITILNKSPNTIKEYNYDLAMFLKYIKKHFKMTSEDDLKKIEYNDLDLSVIKKIKLEDIHSYISYMATVLNSKPATRARKIASIRVFFLYLSQKAKLIDENPALTLESPKLRETNA